ncbi:MAG: hypothetical protein PHZ25_00015 [Candidatus Pacebacteria bacterium]|nr:hypothetical protein [Candidatus Paceibacterota bacterium]
MNENFFERFEENHGIDPNNLFSSLNLPVKIETNPLASLDESIPETDEITPEEWLESSRKLALRDKDLLKDILEKLESLPS